MTKKKLLTLLKQEMLLAMGCTEPAASALSGAKAWSLISDFGQEIERVEIYASRDIIKNAMGVGLPSCDLKGIQAAVALGIAIGDISQGLGILSHITPSHIQRASKIKTSLTMVENVPPLYVQTKVFTSDHYSQASIITEHDHFDQLMVDGQPVIDTELKSVNKKDEEKAVSKQELIDLSLDEVVKIANTVTQEEAQFLLDAVKTNMKIAKEGLTGNYGLSVGYVAKRNLSDTPQSLSEAFELGAALASGGSDARMAGCSMGVIINSGSGNQGLCVTLPVYVVAKFVHNDPLLIARSLFVSQVVALMLTARKDRLSALCGAFTASIATSCAYVYTFGGNTEVMDRAINLMVGNLAGIICDGAKQTCALKIYSSLNAAALSTKIALEGKSPREESGICGIDSLQSIEHLCRISFEGMEQTDKTILSIMLNKKC